MERQLVAIGQLIHILTVQLAYTKCNAMRRRRNAEFLMRAIAASALRRRAPYIWERQRQQDFWEVIVNTHFTPNLWLQHFRMSEATFEMLCNIIGPHVAPIQSPGRPPIATKKRIAIALYKLATCAEYRVVGEVFGVRKTSVHRCVYAVCRAIRFKMLSEFVKLPDVCEAQAIAHRNSTHLVPQVYGALDATHIPILPPSNGYRDYVNRKGWPSIVLQALVDDRYQFRDICVGTLGSAHDAAVFTTSNLYR